MSIRVLALAGLALSLAMPQALAQSADFTRFDGVCIEGTSFFLGPLPEGVDPKVLLTPLCGCLKGEFAPLPQADLDMLTSDIEGTSTEATQQAFGNYPALLEAAAAGLQVCYGNPDFLAAVQSYPQMLPQDEPATPADPAAPAVPVAPTP
jgi:hypothetical protein